MIFPPKLLSHQPILRGLFSLFLVCFSIYSLISEASSPSPKFLTRFTLTHLHHWSFTLTHSSIRPHPFTLTDSPLPIHPHPHPFSRVFGFGLRFCKNEAPSVLVLTVRWVLINVLEFLCLRFFSLSTRKRGIQLVFVFGFWSKSCCWCLQRWWFFFEWVCFGDDFF